jgi:photosynthetic reaction center H subunit
MQTGAITSYIDVAQVALYAFWIFFAGLIIYLRREDKREGYPLVSERSGGRIKVQGWPALPKPKEFILPHGGTLLAPRVEAPEPPVAASPVGLWLGAPLQPTGNPLVDGVGPAAYATGRSDHPDLFLDDGKPKILPLRVATDYSLAAQDPDPRGMTVLGADRKPAGTVTEVWVDRAEYIARFLEVEVAANGRHAMVPVPLCDINGTARTVTVHAVLAQHFADAPVLASQDQITLREEDRTSAYFAGGQLYATPDRLGPIL